MKARESGRQDRKGQLGFCVSGFALSPARSYEQTRAKAAMPGWTRLQSTEKSPAPASKMTVGRDARRVPVQFR